MGTDKSFGLERESFIFFICKCGSSFSSWLPIIFFRQQHHLLSSSHPLFIFVFLFGSRFISFLCRVRFSFTMRGFLLTMRGFILRQGFSHCWAKRSWKIISAQDRRTSPLPCDEPPATCKIRNLAILSIFNINPLTPCFWIFHPLVEETRTKLSSSC